MARIRPFRALRYDPDIVGDLEHVVAPPYDVISAEQQHLLHLRSPYNAVHLDFNSAADRYATAATTLQTWRAQGALCRDATPSIYGYAQDFTLDDGQPRRRLGFFAALRVEDFASGVIRPHERTFERAKEDRLALLHACRTHLSSIFCLYAGKGWALADTLPVESARPDVAIRDAAGVRHRVWSVSDPKVIDGLAAKLADEPLIIADGHHRYETALRYSREREAASGGDEPFRYVLAYLTDANDAGLTILPTHRLLREIRLPAAVDLFRVLSRDFRVTRYPLSAGDAFSRALTEPGPARRIGCVVAGAEHYWLLSFDDRAVRGLTVSPALKGLDVTVLHDAIFAGVLGLPPDVQKQRVTYTSDEAAALDSVANGEHQAAFLLRPTSFAQVERICAGGETMPQKSTYFYPKLLTGLVFQPLEDW